MLLCANYPTISCLTSRVEIVVDAVECIRTDDGSLNLHMIEIMHMRHNDVMNTRFVDGLVLDTVLATCS